MKTETSGLQTGQIDNMKKSSLSCFFGICGTFITELKPFEDMESKG